jgi:uncharacterized protein (DUF1810 family)
MEKRNTPESITELKADEVFVFGSNLAGAHAGGAARIAMEKFGAVWGQGVGLQGQSYAIPTMQGGVETIKPYVDEFVRFAKSHTELVFLVTRIGCGIAGFKDEEIAPLFADVLNIDNIILPESFDNILRSPSVKRAKRPDVKRFLEAQNREYAGYKQALEEVRGGEKHGHWIWYVFPQVKGLGYSEMANYYGIKDREEGEDYLLHPTLNDRIHEISKVLLQHEGKTAVEIFGRLDAMKVKSSMTLFDELSPNDVFAKVLDAFYDGERDEKTLMLLDEQ